MMLRLTQLSSQINILIDVHAIYNPNIFVNDKGQIKTVPVGRKSFSRPIWIVNMEISPPVPYEKGTSWMALRLLTSREEIPSPSSWILIPIYILIWVCGGKVDWGTDL